MDFRNTERPECKIDDAIRPEDDYQSDEPPHNRLPSLCAFRLVSRVCNEIKYAPKEDDKRARCQKKNNRINYLNDHLVEELVEYGHYLLIGDGESCWWGHYCVSSLGSGSEDVHETPDGDHHEEADKTPEHKVLTLLLHLFIVRAEDKNVERAPEEDDKRYREEDRYEDVIDGIDKLSSAFHVGNCSKRYERHSERGKNSEAMAMTFHSMGKWITG